MIKTFVGPMFSGKSDALISTYIRIWNKDLVIAFKPECDVRDGSFIKSKNYDISIPAIYIKNISEIPYYIETTNAKTIFIDEVQFLEGDSSLLVDMSILYDVDFYIAGLNMTSEQKPFGIIPEVLAVSDEVVNIRGFCQDCNRPSVYTYYASNDKTGDVLVGDNGYMSLCPNCLRKRKDNKILSLKKH